jgi:hypothetical protein
MNVHKITVCGGGNGAQTLVPIGARNLGCHVDIYAPFADEAERLRLGVDAQDGLEVRGAESAKARPRRISADPAEVIPGSDVVVLVLPAFAHNSMLRQISPHLDEGAWVGAMPARGGFDYDAVQALGQLGRQDVRIFGLQTLPWACRIESYGRVVHVLGVKDAVDVASRPAGAISEIASLLARMLGLAIGRAGDFLALTLANTGQLIHPGIMYGLFANWDGKPFTEAPLFYQGLSPEGAAVLAALSEEVQEIRARLAPWVDLSVVRPLLAWLLYAYGDGSQGNGAVRDPSSLHSAFVSNRAYAGLKAPVQQIAPGQFVPDFRARYLAEDVPFGLAVSRAIAGLAGVDTPMMDRIIAWAGRHLGKDYFGRDAHETRIPQKAGLQSLEALLDFAAERVGPAA